MELRRQALVRLGVTRPGVAEDAYTAPAREVGLDGDLGLLGALGVRLEHAPVLGQGLGEGKPCSTAV